jgi:predicted nucleic acid-binding protein
VEQPPEREAQAGQVSTPGNLYRMGFFAAYPRAYYTHETHKSCVERRSPRGGNPRPWGQDLLSRGEHGSGRGVACSQNSEPSPVFWSRALAGELAGDARGRCSGAGSPEAGSPTRVAGAFVKSVILVDTSSGFELLAGRRGKKVSEAELLNFATCGPIVQEVLQGLRNDPASERLRDVFLALPMLSDPLPARLFFAAAHVYRLGRAKSYTIRSSTDCLIAAIAIENRTPVWHSDRDYDAIARYTSLQAIRFA